MASDGFDAFWEQEEHFLDEARVCLTDLRQHLRFPVSNDLREATELQERLLRMAVERSQARQKQAAAGKPWAPPETRRRIQGKLAEVGSALRQQFWYLKISQELFRSVLEDRGWRGEGDCRYSSEGRPQTRAQSAYLQAEG